MSEIINCTSCGASNQLPYGKNSMFCAFCGNSIQTITKTNTINNESSIKTKPSVSKQKIGQEFEPKYSKSGDLKKYKEVDTIIDYGGELSLINREIKSLNEVSSWFTDNELSEITKLILKDNKITNLEGIERFKSLKFLDLSNNEIFELPESDSFLQNIAKVNLAGNPIEKKINAKQKIFYSNFKFLLLTKTKAELIHDSLEKTFILNYHNKDIENLEEIIDLYSNDELYKIGKINFTNNRINTLKSLSKFSCNEINFANNSLTLIDDLPKFRSGLSGATLRLTFDNNKNLKEFTDKAIEHFYDVKISHVTIYLRGCDNFDYDSLSKINFNQIFNKANCELTNFKIYVNENVMIPKSLIQIGFVKGNSCWGFGFGYKKTGCFIATATMGSYDHPIVMELRSFRDNWILAKSWGDDFVKWYYHYGSKVAKVIEKSFLFKKISYILIVKPLVYLSRILKNNYD
tara:strand:+ start:3203 stop:4585 length:1383 start_codon:yes stop_codon:yes gene_type:complete